MLDAITRRRSVRKYDDQPLTGDLRARVEAVLAVKRACFFGGVPRFALVDRDAAREEQGVKLGTYGFIKGARTFVAGAIAAGPTAELDFGYALEAIILELTAMGLGTCWLGGTFSRADYGRVLSLTGDEFVPAVTPVGVAAPQRGAVERLVRWGAKSDSRLPWARLFFDRRPDRPLTKVAAGEYAEVLEALRRAPSASNKQPWRVLRTDDGFEFHLLRTPGYGKLVPAADLQHIDMGIAMCHFEVAARALDLPGAWAVTPPPGPFPELGEYVVTWS